MKINKNIIYLLLLLCSFSLGSCTIFLTESLRKNKDLFDEMNTNDTTGYFVPNSDYGFTNIDSMMNRTFDEEGDSSKHIAHSDIAKKLIPDIEKKMLDNDFYEIDSVLKHNELDSLGQVKKIDTLKDSTGKHIIKETIYSKEDKELVAKTETLIDNKNNFSETIIKVYDKDGRIVSADVNQKENKKFLGILSYSKEVSIWSDAKYRQYNDNDYNITLTNLDDSYYPDSIILNLTLQNKDGEFISGLAEPYLSKNKKQSDYWKYVNENCKNINDTITNLKVEEIRDVKSQKNNICFVLDHSGSMGEERCMYLQQAVYYVSKQINEEDYLSAIKFTNKAVVEVEPTNDKELFRSLFKINGMAPGKYGNGGTDILCAVDSSISVLLRAPSDYNRIVVLFTDGESSMKRLKDVMKRLIANKCKVFTICYGRVDMKVMKQIANGTFGRTYKIKDVRDFADAFKEIYNTLTNYYKVVYTPPVCADLHKININMELPKFNVKENDLPIQNIKIDAEYDKSVLTDYADIGTMTLIDIEFEYNKATIDSSSIPNLLDIVAQLKRNNSINIQIAGHTDDIGTDDYNQKLSLARANSIKDFLVENGINKSRIKTIGYGKSKPIFPNDSDENRKKNRRTEFIVIE